MWKRTKNMELPNRREVSALAISADGTRLVAGDKAGRVHLLDLETDGWLGHHEHHWAVVEVAVSSDGAAVASVARGQKRARGKSELASWCVDVGQVVVRPNRPGMAYRCPRFLNDGSRFAVKCGEIGIYDPVTGGNGQSIPEQTTGDLFAISPDGSQLAFAARTGRIHVWQLREQLDQPAAKFERDSFAEVGQLAFSADGCLLLSLDDAGTLRIYDCTSGELRTESEGPLHRVVACGWIPSLNGWGVVDDSSQLWQVTPDGESKLRGDRLLNGTVAAAAIGSAAERLTLASGSRIKLFELEAITVEA